ncbi:MAG: hypothetical protein BroJett011_51160 [Chloroflexota bacterium]|nr:MAG: hypothetical protein BroJett011_51160 [Chloroflexota bacterium]
MPSFEEDTHVFILRIWREGREIEGAEPVWRGVIEHVPSGERRYLGDLDEVSDFIVPYLEAVGVEFRKDWRIKNWFRRLVKAILDT